MCESCPREKSVTLLDGSTCCTWCEKYRAETEARWLLKMPSRVARRRYLDGSSEDPRRPSVLKNRGEAAVKALEGLALKIWEKSR